MESKKLARLCKELAENKKAEDIVILDIQKLTSIADYFVIMSGTSEPHVRAIVDEIVDKLKTDYQLRPRAIDGIPGSPWVVLDYDEVIVHVAKPEIRKYYDLEGLWSDAKRLRTRRSRKTKAVIPDS
jgi:ribosome-associated protein